MNARDPTLWMWGEALELLERADRLQRQFCQLRSARRAAPTWEPPVDVFETERHVIIVVALPGVMAEQVQLEIEGTGVVVRGQRRLPGPVADALIHRLELPYGVFERRIELPGRALQLLERKHADGCLTITLDKAGALS
jgi:HSP20 family molecular chaperone IbpA